MSRDIVNTTSNDTNTTQWTSPTHFQSVREINRFVRAKGTPHLFIVKDRADGKLMVRVIAARTHKGTFQVQSPWKKWYDARMQDIVADAA